MEKYTSRSLSLLTEFTGLHSYDLEPHFLGLLTGGCPEIPNASCWSWPCGVPPHDSLLHQTPRRNSPFREGSDLLLKAFTCYNQAHSGSVKFSGSVMSDSLRPHGRSMPAFLVHHQLPELTQTYSNVHCIGDAIQPSHLLL